MLRVLGRTTRMGCVISKQTGIVGVSNDKAFISCASTQSIALAADPPKPFSLKEKKQLTSNTCFLRFTFPETLFGANVSSCVGISANIDGEDVMRPYTPISRPSSEGVVDFVIKEYPAPDGKMSRYLNSLEVGDVVNIKGPWKKLEYKSNMKKEIGLIAGGSGITPCFQVLQEILDNKPEDKTRVTLLFANRTPEDIIMKERLDALAAAHKDFTLVYTVSSVSEQHLDGWKGEVGRINADMVLKYLPKPSEDSMVYVCGPNGQMQSICGTKNEDKSQGTVRGILKELGFDESNVYKF